MSRILQRKFYLSGQKWAITSFFLPKVSSLIYSKILGDPINLSVRKS